MKIIEFQQLYQNGT